MTSVFINDTAVVVGYPPNYNQIIESGLHPAPQAIFAWGERIYSPSAGRISGDLIAHEKVHMKQQADFGGPEKWWEKYLSDSQFRLDQEAKAYGKQYQFICSQNPNRNYQFQVLQALALTLAGPMYGSITSQGEAMKLIRGNS